MKMELLPVEKQDKEILRNLLEKYNYEFSRYDGRDVNSLGLYDYSYLDHYWTEKNRWAFFMKVDGKLAGFAMVNDYPESQDEETDYTMAEFFVMYKYRRCGVGGWACRALFEKFPGRWQLRRHPNNIGSVHFWDKIVAECSGGNFRLMRSHPAADYDDGTLGDVFFFQV